MVLQHFGLTQYPLGKAHTELWDDGFLAQLTERFSWLLETPGVGLLTGEAGVGKTAALRQLTQRPVASDQGPYPGAGRRQRRHAAVDHRRGTQPARGVLS
ncbi:MAG: hypothetical protein P8Y25_06355 [Chromatiaceae bacterium]